MSLSSNFKMPPWYKLIWGKIVVWWKHVRYPENIWYGGSLKRETALHSVGPGWSPIIHLLYDEKPRKTRVIQVKEKFGTLRFYVELSPPWYDELIEKMEWASAYICEQCGKPGKLREDRSWILTLCDECNREK